MALRADTVKRKGGGAFLLDALMLLLLPLLMAYSLIGETFHEAAGVTMGVLFWIHFFRHLGFYKALGRGTYTPYRRLLAAVDLLLCLNLLLQPLTGILMSKHLFPWLPVTDLAGPARLIHLTLGYWGYVLMSFHTGLHLPAMRKRLWKDKPLPAPVKAAGALLGAFGIYAFFHQQFPSYMTLQSEFLFLDESQPLALFLLEFLAVMVLFLLAGSFAAVRAQAAAEKAP